MPVHDWSRANAWVFHHFHSTWIVHLAEKMNAGRLPKGYFAVAEQRTDLFAPDVLTGILGYDDDRITELILAGALE